MTARRARLVGATVLACLGATTSFGALYQGWGWLLPTVLTVLVVVAASEAVRRSRLPSAIGPLVAAATTTAAICWLETGNPLPLARERAVLATLLHQGSTVVHRYAAPVPAGHGAVLLAVIGIGAVALVVDLAVLTLDRVALAAPPLVAVYVVAALLTHRGVGWWPFVLVTGGLLVLFAAEAAATQQGWGHQFGPGRAGLAPGPGRRLGGAALAVAVVLPALLPGLHAGLPHSAGTGSGPGNGPTHVVTVNPLVSVADALQHQSNVRLLSYRTTSTTPGYLRLTALDDFDGTTFTAAQLHSATSHPVTDERLIPGQPPARVRPPATTSLRVLGLDQHWAPAPEGAVSTDIGAEWLWDPLTATIWSSETTTDNINYTVQSQAPVSSAAVLGGIDFSQEQQSGSAVPAADRQVPTTVSPRVRALARRLAGATPYATALAIQRHLLSPPFGYDLSVPPIAGSDPLARFLFGTHLGFCQQYAAAMAALARIDGIPARVVVGFTSGQRVGGHWWVVTGADAHAWPELFFPGQGWLPFEPTPRADGQTETPPYATAGTPRGQRAHPSHLPPAIRKQPPAPKRSARQGTVRPAPAAAGSSGAHPSGVGSDVGWALLALVLLGLVLPGIWRWGVRRRHAHPRTPAAAAHAAWEEVKDTAVDVGYEWVDGLTPRAATHRLLRSVAALQPVGDALQRIALAEQEARYAREVTVDVGPALRADVAAVRAVLLQRAGRAGRLRATLLPRSSLRAAATVLRGRPGSRPATREPAAGRSSPAGRPTSLRAWPARRRR